MSARRLLATDLDGTFIGDHDAMFGLWNELEEHGIVVAFSTGRHLSSIESFRAEVGAVSRPDACICMVGTEIWHRRESGYVRDQSWADFILDRWDKDSVDDALRHIPRLERQPDEWQSPLKRSYFVDAADAEATLELVGAALDEAAVAAKVIHSHDRFLDVLPVRSGKGGAVTYLAEHLGVAAGDVVTAGDSGNDIDMMQAELGFRSIAVANAAPELTAFRHERLHHARAPYARGIREGLVRFGWLPA